MRQVIILFDSRLKQQLDIINLGSYQQTQKNLFTDTNPLICKHIFLKFKLKK